MSQSFILLYFRCPNLLFCCISDVPIFYFAVFQMTLFRWRVSDVPIFYFAVFQMILFRWRVSDVPIFYFAVFQMTLFRWRVSDVPVFYFAVFQMTLFRWRQKFHWRECLQPVASILMASWDVLEILLRENCFSHYQSVKVNEYLLNLGGCVFEIFLKPDCI